MIKLMELSSEEREVENILDKWGLLQDMSKDHFRRKKDVAVGCCPDGRHFIRGVLEPMMKQRVFVSCLSLGMEGLLSLMNILLLSCQVIPRTKILSMT